MKTINLLPKEQSRQLRLEILSGQLVSFWMWIIISMVFVLVLSLTAAFLLKERIGINQEEIELKKSALRTQATQELEQEVSSLNNQIKIVNNLRKDHYYWSQAMAELTRMVDSETRLTNVRMERTSNKITVSGVAADRESMLSFWSSVTKSDLFKDIDFPLANLEKPTEVPFYFSFYVDEKLIKLENE